MVWLVIWTKTNLANARLNKIDIPKVKRGH
jgi:hypothetical protein